MTKKKHAKLFEAAREHCPAQPQKNKMPLAPQNEQKIFARLSAQRFFANPMAPAPSEKNLIDQDLQIIASKFAKDDPLTPPLLPTYGNCFNFE